MLKRFIAVLAILTLMSNTVPAFAEPMDAMMVPDVLIARPLGLAAIVIGSVIFIIALPVSIPSGSVGDVGRVLVKDSIEYTFIRPVGDMDYKVGTWGAEKDKTE